jgi:hypothetical protein
MKVPGKIVTSVLAAALAFHFAVTPASAAPLALFGGSPFSSKIVSLIKKIVKIIRHKHASPVTPPSTSKSSSGGGGSNAGPYIVGCVMGSALGIIGAAAIKYRSKGYRHEWMSQAKFEQYVYPADAQLTSDEIAAIGFTCGLGFFPVVANFDRQN